MLEQMPKEIYENIFRFFPSNKDLKNLSQSSKSLRAVVYSHTLKNLANLSQAEQLNFLEICYGASMPFLPRDSITISCLANYLSNPSIELIPKTIALKILVTLDEGNTQNLARFNYLMEIILKLCPDIHHTLHLFFEHKKIDDQLYLMQDMTKIERQFYSHRLALDDTKEPLRKVVALAYMDHSVQQKYIPIVTKALFDSLTLIINPSNLTNFTLQNKAVHRWQVDSNYYPHAIHFIAGALTFDEASALYQLLTSIPYHNKKNNTHFGVPKKIHLGFSALLRKLLGSEQATDLLNGYMQYRDDEMSWFNHKIKSIFFLIDSLQQAHADLLFNWVVNKVENYQKNNAYKIPPRYTNTGESFTREQSEDIASTLVALFSCSSKTFDLAEKATNIILDLISILEDTTFIIALLEKMVVGIDDASKIDLYKALVQRIFFKIADKYPYGNEPYTRTLAVAWLIRMLTKGMSEEALEQQSKPVISSLNRDDISQNFTRWTRMHTVAFINASRCEELADEINKKFFDELETYFHFFSKPKAEDTMLRVLCAPKFTRELMDRILPDLLERLFKHQSLGNYCWPNDCAAKEVIAMKPHLQEDEAYSILHTIYEKKTISPTMLISLWVIAEKMSDAKLNALFTVLTRDFATGPFHLEDWRGAKKWYHFGSARFPIQCSDFFPILTSLLNRMQDEAMKKTIFLELAKEIRSKVGMYQGEKHTIIVDKQLEKYMTSLSCLLLTPAFDTIRAMLFTEVINLFTNIKYNGCSALLSPIISTFNEAQWLDMKESDHYIADKRNRYGK